MYRLFALVSILCFTLFCGCASIVSDSKYPVAVSSEPSEAIFKVVDNRGMTIFQGKTPTVVSLKSGNGYFKNAKYKVIFEKAGYQSITSEIEASFDGWYVGNILFLGSDFLLGFLVIDPLTGAMWKIDENVYVELLQVQ